MKTVLKAPFPWFGGKSRAADLIWARFGDVDNYVEPFFGSGAVLLARPDAPGSETINDLDCYVANFWRAVQLAPAEVARWADSPVNEADLHARHTWLVSRAEFRERMLSDPDHFDPKIAGWWVWGLSCWIGGGWCALREKTWRQRPDLRPRTERKRPNIAGNKSGNGVHQKMPELNAKGSRGAVSRQLIALDAMCGKGTNNTDNLQDWFASLAARLRRTRVACGDWSRVLKPTPLGLTDNVPPGFRTGVMLDPPYDPKHRNSGLYAKDGTKTLSAEVREWAIANGDHPRLRIALCGYAEEHAMPDSWECVSWKAAGGYGNQTGNQNAHLERIWFSPHCLSADATSPPLRLMRNISCSLTTPQVRARTKDVTRRLGWEDLKPGERLQACEKCMGRKPGEPLVRICVIEVVNVRRETLRRMLRNPVYGRHECRREGFPFMSPAEFVTFFCASHKRCTPDTPITRIEFRYV